MNKRLFIQTAGALAAGLACRAFAQDYPSKPIRWVVGYPPGGGSDMVARTIADQLRKELGQAVVVENRPGATTAIAAEAVARAAPDGYTIFSPDNGTLINNPAIYSKLSYDPVKDFAPVSLIVRINLLLVAHPDFPARDLPAFVRQIKDNPNKFSYASPGKGTPHHLAMELFKSRAGDLVVQDVAYRGSAPALQDVLAGQLPFMVLDVGSTLPHLQAGKLKVYAAIAEKRLESLPDVPAVKEFGFDGVDVYAWQGVVVPAGTPASVIDRLNAALAKAIAQPEVQTKLRAVGMVPLSTTPEEFRAKIESETVFWHPFIRRLNIRLD
ncbi:MAG: tripartite tricarboxylate transporter substrate binding protein [Burkholderiaceae bacterium]|nr:tripartite tricarboxylate transporter substrate binding protein [Burkholderiaceae bacterium]